MGDCTLSIVMTSENENASALDEAIMAMQALITTDPAEQLEGLLAWKNRRDDLKRNAIDCMWQSPEASPKTM